MVESGQPPLRLIGYWAGPDAPGWPDPKDFVDKSWDAYDRDLVVDYLTAGIIIRGYCGYSKCRFCGKNNGGLERTDGIWYWPDGLVHYLTEHDVRLPQDFVDHVYARVDGLCEADRDVDWWRSRRVPL